MESYSWSKHVCSDLDLLTAPPPGAPKKCRGTFLRNYFSFLTPKNSLRAKVYNGRLSFALLMKDT